MSKSHELKVIDLQMTFDPRSVEVTCVILPKDHCVQVPWKYIKVYGYSDPFFKNLNQRSLTPRWPLTPASVKVTCVTLTKDHCVQVPWEYIYVCGYSDEFCKIPHTNYILHTTYYVQSEWSHSRFLNTVQARQKWVNNPLRASGPISA